MSDGPSSDKGFALPFFSGLHIGAKFLAPILFPFLFHVLPKLFFDIILLYARFPNTAKLLVEWLKAIEVCMLVAPPTQCPITTRQLAETCAEKIA